MVNILTNRFGNTRTGANQNETILTVANVNMHQFGKLFTRDVDGDIYGQPLVAAVPLPQHGQRNVVFVTTAHNSVYAYDADDPAMTTPYWRLSQAELGAAVPRTEVGGVGYKDFQKTIGITSTPVIDLASNTIYFEVKSKADGRYFHHLHARDIRTGMAKPNSPMEISGSVPGTGCGSNQGHLSFDPRAQLNRPGLLLMDGVIYLAFASHGDHGAYHGWVFAYDAATLQKKAMYCTTPDSCEGGIWQSGCGLTGANGKVYCVAGNGHLEARNLANCIVQLELQPGPELRATAFYAPANANDLSSRDLDLSTGATLLPAMNLIVAGSKEGIIYVADFTQIDGAHQAQLVQAFRASLVMVSPPPDEQNPRESNIHGTPVLWMSAQHGLVLYVWGENDYLRAWRHDGHFFSYLAHSPMHAPPGMPGGILSLSANGSADATGILWASHPYLGDANRMTTDGILRAFDADDLSRELWNSKQEPHRDDVGKFAKFCPPTVANGKVYLATFSDPATQAANHLVVYGLLPHAPPPPTSPWHQADLGTPIVGSVGIGSGRYVVRGAGDDIEGLADSFHFVYQTARNDCRIQARVRSVGNTNEWAKAGVMIRQTLMPESPHAVMLLTPRHGPAFQRRLAVGQILRHTPGPAANAPYWLRLERVGTTLTGFVSADNMQWHQVGAEQIDLGSSVLIGLAVTAHNGSLQPPLPINESIFDNLTVTVSE